MKNNTSGIIFSFAIIIAIFCSCSAPKSTSSGNSSSSGKMVGVARMQVKEPIPGVCDNANVIVVLPIPGNGQVKAKAPKTTEEITKELNVKVVFLKDQSNYEDKGMVSLIINCKGDLVRCEIDNKTRSAELDAQIVAVFAELKTWKPGTMFGKPIDTVELVSITIKNGKITLS